MEENGKNPACCRCGVCCLSAVCQVGQAVFGIDPSGPCPALLYNGTSAASQCRLAVNETMAKALTIGEGCTMVGEVVNQQTGQNHIFASLDPQSKRFISKGIAQGKIRSSVRGIDPDYAGLKARMEALRDAKRIIERGYATEL